MRRQPSPEQIQARSFEIISELLPDFDQSSPAWPIVRRIVHTTGDPAVASLLRIHSDAVSAGIDALLAGRPVLTDVKMLAAGINRKLAGRLGCDVICAIEEPTTLALASDRGLTRSAAAIVALKDTIPGSVVAIGNAPTALFALMDLMDEGLEPPALIIGTPVGFVGAAESKKELVERTGRAVPFITLEGNRGGSAIAVAAVNALLVLATGDLDRRTEARS